MPPKKPKLSPPKPNGPPAPEKVFVRVPKELWDEMCIAATRYYYVRTQHEQPARFDMAVDAGIAEEDRMAKLAAGLSAADKSGLIQ